MMVASRAGAAMLRDGMRTPPEAIIDTVAEEGLRRDAVCVRAAMPLGPALARRCSERSLRWVAQAMDCPPDVLRRAAVSTAAIVRRAAAAHHALRIDPDVLVRAAMAMRADAPAPYLVSCLHDAQVVALAAFRRQDLPPELVAEAATNWNSTIRQAIADHPCCSVDVLRRLARDADAAVATAARRRLSLAEQAAVDLAEVEI